MDRYSIDYDNLENSVNSPKYYKYSEVKDRLVKVAFDIVKFQDASEDIDGLWQIKATDDGEIIVAMYEQPSLSAESNSTLEKKTASLKTSFWEVLPGRDKSMNFFYKGEAIHRVASSDMGISEINSNPSFKDSLFEEVPKATKLALFNKYPELTK